MEVATLLDQPWSSRRRFEASNDFCKQSKRLAHDMHAEFLSPKIQPAKSLKKIALSFVPYPSSNWAVLVDTICQHSCATLLC